MTKDLISLVNKLDELELHIGSAWSSERQASPQPIAAPKLPITVLSFAERISRFLRGN
jgi:hypothetical protein